MTPIRKGDYLTSLRIICTRGTGVMYAYVLSTSRDAAGIERCNLASAHLHVSEVERFARLDHRAGRLLRKRLLECEMAIRIERARAQQTHHELSLTEIIHIVGQRHSAWPVKMGFRPSPPSKPTAWGGYAKEKGHGKGMRMRNPREG